MSFSSETIAEEPPVFQDLCLGPETVIANASWAVASFIPRPQSHDQDKLNESGPGFQLSLICGRPALPAVAGVPRSGFFGFLQADLHREQEGFPMARGVVLSKLVQQGLV